MYAALLSGCMFAAALAPARLPNSRIMRQPGLSWTGLYDEHGRPVTMDELRAHKFVYKDFRDPLQRTQRILVPIRYGKNSASTVPMGRSHSKIRGGT